MVVLNTAVGPGKGLDELAVVLGCDLAGDGYVARPDADLPRASSSPGVYVAGAAGGPTTLGETLEEARAAAAVGLAHVDERLLRADAAAAGDADAQPAAGAVPEAEVRARIERALFAMLDSGK